MNFHINSSPPAFLAESEEEKLEVLVQAIDKTPSEEDQEEIKLETPDIFPVKPFTRNRRSAKSRLGVISANQGFHSVKLPVQRRLTSTTDSVINNTEVSIDGENRRNQEIVIRRKRLVSVSGKELWKCTRQHVEERKIDFDKRMSQVQNIARRYTIKHSQSVRRRAKEKSAIPRRSTMAASAANEAMRQEFAMKRNGCLQEDCMKELFQEEVEELVEDEDTEPEKGYIKDFLDGRSAARGETFESEMKEQREDDERESGIASVKGDEPQAETKDQQQATSIEEGSSLLEDNSSHQVKKKDKEKPVKRVSLLEITEILDV